MFYCILNLHYSQTGEVIYFDSDQFYCILNLHYSQTLLPTVAAPLRFYCILNLHYSQTYTSRRIKIISFTVF